METSPCASSLPLPLSAVDDEESEAVDPDSPRIAAHRKLVERFGHLWRAMTLSDHLGSSAWARAFHGIRDRVST